MGERSDYSIALSIVATSKQRGKNEEKDDEFDGRSRAYYGG